MPTSSSSSTRQRAAKASSSSSRKPKFQVMEQSGQTDVERRELRRELRQLQATILTQSYDIENAKSESFATIRNQTNDLWKQVRFTREAVLDGVNLETFATRAARQIDKLVEVPRYDAVRFATKLKQNLSNGSTSSTFDWAQLGSEVGVCFNALPSAVCFLAGPLHADYTPKQRKKSERRIKMIDSDAEEEEPEDVKEQAKDGDKLSAVEQNIQVVSSVLARKCRAAAAEDNSTDDDDDDDDEQSKANKRRRIGEISAVETLFNPKSFTQTVENLFHFSFILKKGLAQLYSTDDKGPMMNNAPSTDEHPPPSQAILSLNMRDWRRMTQAYGVEKSHVPHRTGSRHARASCASPGS